MSITNHAVLFNYMCIFTYLAGKMFLNELNKHLHAKHHYKRIKWNFWRCFYAIIWSFGVTVRRVVKFVSFIWLLNVIFKTWSVMGEVITVALELNYWRRHKDFKIRGIHVPSECRSFVCRPVNNNSTMTISIGTDVAFEGPRCNRVVAKQKLSHSTALADK